MRHLARKCVPVVTNCHGRCRESIAQLSARQRGATGRDPFRRYRLDLGPAGDAFDAAMPHAKASGIAGSTAALERFWWSR
jgi:hypothetical protein